MSRPPSESPPSGRPLASLGQYGAGRGNPTWRQLMTKVWPRNTLCSTPDWASKARAQASPLPVNTVDTQQQYTGPFLAATLPPPQEQHRVRGWCDIHLPHRDILRVRWEAPESLSQAPLRGWCPSLSPIELARLLCLHVSRTLITCSRLCPVHPSPVPRASQSPSTLLRKGCGLKQSPDPI